MSYESTHGSYAFDQMAARESERDDRIAARARKAAPIEWAMTESQRRERAKQEIAMRNGLLRRIPTVFGDL